MSKVLVVTSSPRGENSLSSRTALEVAQQLGTELTVRELWKHPLPSIGPDYLQATFTPEESRNPEQTSLASLSDQAIEELLAADYLVIGAGMINFSLPATLKTWIDHIVRAGVTFRYTKEGALGLVQGKKAVLVLAYGGVYSEPPMQAFDHLEPTLRNQLGFIGITDIETIRIEGTAIHPQAEQEALQKAKNKITTTLNTLKRQTT